jgi:L-malate glycosyltransferase
MEDYLQAADMGLFTSEAESFCLSILEACILPAPVLHHRSEESPKVVQDKITGLLTPFGDSEKMARAAENLIQDATLRTTLGRAAQAPAYDQFSAKTIVPRYETIYWRVRDTSKSRGNRI